MGKPSILRPFLGQKPLGSLDTLTCRKAPCKFRALRVCRLPGDLCPQKRPQNRRFSDDIPSFYTPKIGYFLTGSLHTLRAPRRSPGPVTEPRPLLGWAGFLVMGGPIFGSKIMEYHRQTVDFEAILRSKTTRNAPGCPLSIATIPIFACSRCCVPLHI